MELATKYAELKEFTFYFIYINTGNLEDVVDNNINLITQEQKEQILKLEEETV